MNEPADERAARADICGVETIVNGKTWVCIAAVHDNPPRPGHGHRSEQWPTFSSPYPPRSARHYYVRKYPDTGH